MINTLQIQKQYSQDYKYAPIGHLLKDKYPARYLRIHHLPNERYPVNEEDNQRIITLYKELFALILDKEKSVGFLSTYDRTLEEINTPWIPDLDLVYIDKYNILEEDEEPYFIKTYIFSLNNEQSVSQVILDVANELLDESISFYSYETKNIIAPYPGGVDIFIENSQQYEAIKSALDSRIVHSTH